MGSGVRQRGLAGQYSGPALRRYKLNAALSAGGSAEAYWVVWNPTTEAYEAQDGSSGRPTDSFTLYSAFTAAGNSGDEGYAAYFPDRGVWEVVEGTSAQVAIATLTATLNQGSNAAASFVVGGSGSVSGGVQDKLLCSGDSLPSGTTIVIAQISGQWYEINAVCPCS